VGVAPAHKRNRNERGRDRDAEQQAAGELAAQGVANRYSDGEPSDHDRLSLGPDRRRHVDDAGKEEREQDLLFELLVEPAHDDGCREGACEPYE
jgi:hypothetical protein